MPRDAQRLQAGASARRDGADADEARSDDDRVGALGRRRRVTGRCARAVAAARGGSSVRSLAVQSQ